jgi:hypothetical protein
MDEAQHVVRAAGGEPRERVVARGDARRELQGLEMKRAQPLFETADEAGEERFVVGEDECDQCDFPLQTIGGAAPLRMRILRHRARQIR